MHSERNPPTEPPCETCRVIPDPANADANRIFNIVRYQLIMGPASVISVNQLAIHEAMRTYKIRNRQKCFEKVLVLSNWWIKKLNKKADT